MMKTIGELQAEIEAALSRISQTTLPQDLAALKYIVPPGMAARVSLRHAGENRQIRRTADSSYWKPEECILTVVYEQDDSNSSNAETPTRLAELIVALCDAERDARFRDFVGLKAFRDKYLIERGYHWANEYEDRQAVLAQAIDDRLILIGQVPNPKSSANPVTSIRLNRGHPDVENALNSTHEQRSPFNPVAIRGKSLSSTVVAERR